jgi:hypothetical protein
VKNAYILTLRNFSIFERKYKSEFIFEEMLPVSGPVWEILPVSGPVWEHFFKDKF